MIKFTELSFKTIGSCGTYNGFLHGSIHRNISFIKEMCRFLWNLQWVSARFHVGMLGLMCRQTAEVVQKVGSTELTFGRP